LVSLSLAPRLGAEDVVVFARNEFTILGPQSQAAPRDPRDAAFLVAVQAYFAGPVSYGAKFPLINPPAWGRVVRPDTTGTLRICRSFPHGMVFRLDMERFLPGHTYVLCINGRPKHPGNERLPESVPGHEEEKYYDFYTVTTDSQGGYHSRFALELIPGAYNVHFYIKDTTDHKIVLYGLEYFDFTVE